MNRNWKRLLAMLLAASLAFGDAAPVFAAEITQKTEEISAGEAAEENGDAASMEETLPEIETAEENGDEASMEETLPETEAAEEDVDEAPMEDALPETDSEEENAANEPAKNETEETMEEAGQAEVIPEEAQEALDADEGSLVEPREYPWEGIYEPMTLDQEYNHDFSEGYLEKEYYFVPEESGVYYVNSAYPEMSVSYYTLVLHSSTGSYYDSDAEKGYVFTGEGLEHAQSCMMEAGKIYRISVHAYAYNQEGSCTYNLQYAGENQTKELEIDRAEDVLSAGEQAVYRVTPPNAGFFILTLEGECETEIKFNWSGSKSDGSTKAFLLEPNIWDENYVLVEAKGETRVSVEPLPLMSLTLGETVTVAANEIVGFEYVPKENGTYYVNFPDGSFNGRWLDEDGQVRGYSSSSFYDSAGKFWEVYQKDDYAKKLILAGESTAEGQILIQSEYPGTTTELTTWSGKLTLEPGERKTFHYQGKHYGDYLLQLPGDEIAQNLISANEGISAYGEEIIDGITYQLYSAGRSSNQKYPENSDIIFTLENYSTEEKIVNLYTDADFERKSVKAGKTIEFTGDKKLYGDSFEWISFTPEETGIYRFEGLWPEWLYQEQDSDNQMYVDRHLVPLTEGNTYIIKAMWYEWYQDEPQITMISNRVVKGNGVKFSRDMNYVWLTVTQSGTYGSECPFDLWNEEQKTWVHYSENKKVELVSGMSYAIGCYDDSAFGVKNQVTVLDYDYYEAFIASGGSVSVDDSGNLDIRQGSADWLLESQVFTVFGNWLYDVLFKEENYVKQVSTYWKSEEGWYVPYDCYDLQGNDISQKTMESGDVILAKFVPEIVWVDSMEVKGEKEHLEVGETAQIMIDAAPATSKYPFRSEPEYSYLSSDPEVVSVDENGVMTARKPGVALISVAADEKLRWRNGQEDQILQKSFTVTVGDGLANVTVLDYDYYEAFVASGGSVSLDASGKLSIDQGTADWTLQSELLHLYDSYAYGDIPKWQMDKVNTYWKNSEGAFSPVQFTNLKGVDVSKETAADNAVVLVKYEPEIVWVDSMILSAKSTVLKVDETTKISVEIKSATEKYGFADMPEIRFESSNPEIADVDENGVVTAYSEGEVTITAYADESLRRREGLEKQVVSESITFTVIEEREVVFNYELLDNGTAKITGYEGIVRGELNIPSEIAGYKITMIDNFAFDDCINVTSVSIPEGVVSIGLGAFLGCTNMEKVAFPSTLESIGNAAFRLCENLTEVQLPENLTNLGSFAFAECSKLVKINVPEGITSINNATFQKCSFTEIELPEGITFIAFHAFSDCNKLQRINIPCSVTEIDRFAFFNCTSLKKIELPDSVNTIGENAFVQGNLDTEEYENLDITIRCAKNSYPYEWAVENNFRVECTNCYRVQFNTNGGTINSGNITEYLFGNVTKLPTDITKDGYRFVGWYENENFSGDMVTEISAVSTGDKTFYAKWEEIGIQIENIRLNESCLNLIVGSAYQLKATIVPENTTQSKEITWSSSDDNAVSVDQDGMVTALKEGASATITATSVNGKTASCEVKVYKYSISSEELSFDLYNNKVPVTLKVSDGINEGIAATWTSNNTKVATVSSTGKVIPVGVGEAIISAEANGYKFDCEVTVTYNYIQSIEMSETSCRLVYDRNNTEGQETKQLSVSIKPDYTTADQTIKWTSSNENAASVDEKGTVTAKGAGKAIITAETMNGKKASCTVSVYEYELSSAELSFDLFANAKPVTLIAKDGISKSVSATWTSDNPNFATVVGGKVTPVSVGTTTITAAIKNGPELTCKVTVTNNYIKEVTLDKTEYEMTYVEGSENKETVTLKAFINPADTTLSKNVTWESSNTDVATVNQQGIVTAVGAGKAEIIVRATTDSEGNKLEPATCTITVYGEISAPEIGGSLLAITNSQAKLKDVPLPEDESGTWSWENPETTLKQFACMGEAEFTAIYSLNDNDFVKSVKAEIPVKLVTINKLSLEADKTTIMIAGDDQAAEKATITPKWTVTGDASVLDECETEWKSSNEKVATVENGVVTAVGKGSAKITAKVTVGGRAYTAAVTIKVLENQKAAEITVKELNIFEKSGTKDAEYIAVLNADKDANKGTITILLKNASKLTVSNSNAKVVKTSSIKAVKGQTGIFEIPFELLEGGTAKITLTANDALKTTKAIWLTVKDAKPSMEVSVLNINKLQSLEESFMLHPSKDYPVTEIILDGKDAEKFELVVTKDTEGNPTGKCVLQAKEVTGKSNGYKVNVIATANGQQYRFPLTVKVTEVKPRVSVKQSGKINLFYTDSEAELMFTTAEKITGVNLIDCEYIVEFNNETGTWIVKPKADVKDTKADKAGVLEITLEGWNELLKVNFTVGVEKKAPKLALASKSGVLYPVFGINSTQTSALMDGKTFALTEEVSVDVTDKKGNEISGYGYACETDTENDRITFTANDAKEAKNVSVLIKIKDENWNDSVTLSYALTVKTNKPAVKLSKSTVQLNVNQETFDFDVASTQVMWKDATEFAPEGIIVEPADAKAKGAVNSGLEVEVSGDQIVAKLNSRTVAKGTYKFKVSVKASDAYTAVTTLNVKVVDAAAKKSIQLSTKGSIDILNRSGSYVTVTPKFSTVNGNITDVTLSGRNADLFTAELVDGIIQIRLKEEVSVITNYSYGVNLNLEIKNEDEEIMTVVMDETKLSLKQGSVKLSVSPAAGVLYSNADSKVAMNIQAILKGASDPEIEKIELLNYTDAFEYDDSQKELTMKANGEAAKGKSYTLQFEVTLKDKADNVKTMILKYKVTVK